MCNVGNILGGLLGGGDSKPTPTPTPTVATVDPEAERRKAEAEATAKTNEQLLTDARRKRAQKGLTATGDEYGGSVLASGAAPAAVPASTVLGSGGA